MPSSAPVLSRGAIYQTLRNPMYIGQVRRKGICHPGQHELIIDRPLWHQVQQALDDNRTKSKVRIRVTEASTLIGKLIDEAGEGLTPTHTIKRGRRYRYYISRRLMTTVGDSGWRLPAKPFEEAVVHAARQGLNDSVAVSLALQAAGIPAPSFAATIASVKQTAKLSDLDVLGHIIQSVQLRSGGLALKLNLAALMNSPKANDMYGPKVTMTCSVPLEMKRQGVEMRLVLRCGSDSRPISIPCCEDHRPCSCLAILEIFARNPGVSRELITWFV